MAISHNGPREPIEQPGTMTVERVSEDGVVRFEKSATRVFEVPKDMAAAFMLTPPTTPMPGTIFLESRCEEENAEWSKVTFTYGEDPDDSSGSGGDDSVRRTVNVTTSLVDIPIQCSPKYIDMSGDSPKSKIPDDDLKLLAYAMSGQFKDPRNNTYIKDSLTSDMAREIFDYLTLGITHFAYPQTVIRISYPKSKVGSGQQFGVPTKTPGKKGDAIPVKLPEDSKIDFTLISRSINYDGKYHTTDEEYQSSSPLGWINDRKFWGEGE